MSRRREIGASALVPAPCDMIFEFLVELENHWLLGDRFIEVVSLERDAHGRGVGGRVRLRGPLGMRRTASTHVLAADPAHQVVGMAEVGRRTRAFVRWKVRASEGDSRVDLEATVDRTGWLDGPLLVLGGHAWLERQFAAVLDRLADRFTQDDVAGRPTRGESHANA